MSAATDKLAAIQVEYDAAYENLRVLSAKLRDAKNLVENEADLKADAVRARLAELG